ncbi:hypothetical protein KJA16_01755 [Patescibacteria group bacterium]|nr:hypothetical protein [Patescibacteria group bacterium]
MKMIVLDQIDPRNKGFCEAVGISDRQFWYWIHKLEAAYTPASLLEKMKKLGLTHLSVTVASTEKDADNHVFADAVKNLWKEQGRKEISIEECMGTYMLLCTFFGDCKLLVSNS